MKKLLNILAALPLAMLVSCSSEEVPAEVEKDFNLTLDLITDNSTRAGEVLTSANPEEAMDVARLYFATHQADYTMTHYLFGDNTVQSTGLKANYYKGASGPSLNFTLPKSSYSSNFFVTAFSVPEYAKSSFQPTDLSSAANFVINWPGKDADDYWWKPSVGSQVSLIPLAGKSKVDLDALVAGYDDIIALNSPYKLPDIEMTRAMAKVVIEDPYEIIAEVTLTTPNSAYLIPNPKDWLDGKKVCRPNVPATATLIEQKRKTPTGTNASGDRVFEFYAYEMDFSDKGVADVARKIIKLTGNDKITTNKNVTISIAPYTSEGSLKKDIELADLLALNDGAYQGLMRNHIYTFTVHKPTAMGIYVEVHIQNWEYTKINTEL